MTDKALSSHAEKRREVKKSFSVKVQSIYIVQNLKSNLGHKLQEGDLRAP